MSRPFPGFDPYLELPPFWGDFAPTLLASIRNQLLDRLLPDYDVRMEEYLMLTSEEGERLHRLEPDITISTPHWWSDGSGGATAVIEPATSEMEYPETERQTQRHLQIIHQATERDVTVLELLSPTNKAPGQEGGQGEYLKKRTEFLVSGCNLMELDLLRGGRRLPMSKPLPPGDYFALVGRVHREPRCQVFGWPLRAKLPSIPVPLLPDDPEATLDLDAAFATAYEPSHYPRRLPYRMPLVPPPSDRDAGWIREGLVAAGLISATTGS